MAARLQACELASGQGPAGRNSRQRRELFGVQRRAADESAGPLFTAETQVLASILLVHHRDDVYPDPFAFRPERFVGVKPGTYTWIPFGGGVCRCLGAAFTQEEMRIVLREIATRADVRPVNPAPERPRMRNVTIAPEHEARVVLNRPLRNISA